MTIAAQPTVGILVIHVSRVEQSYEHVDIQQGDAHISSRNRLTSRNVGFGAFFFGVSKGTPLRIAGVDFARSDCRARSEIRRPKVTPSSCANSLAAAQRSSSSSRVVRTFLV